MGREKIFRIGFVDISKRDDAIEYKRVFIPKNKEVVSAKCIYWLI